MKLHKHSTKAEFADYALFCREVRVEAVTLDKETYKQAVAVLGEKPTVIGVKFKLRNESQSAP